MISEEPSGGQLLLERMRLLVRELLMLVSYCCAQGERGLQQVVERYLVLNAACQNLLLFFHFLNVSRFFRMDQMQFSGQPTT